jgi:hypothetical protein
LAHQQAGLCSIRRGHNIGFNHAWPSETDRRQKRADPLHGSQSMSSSSRNQLEFGEYQSVGYFSGLDGLRGLAILLVILYHAPRFEPLLLRTLQENGRYGVSLFFVISGFLICTLLLREARETGRISLQKF